METLIQIAQCLDVDVKDLIRVPNVTPAKIKMSRTTNKFSLFDFCKKQAGKMEIYGEETLDEEGNIIPFIEQAALITHNLQLDGKGVILPYRDKAEDILNFWYEFIRSEKSEKKSYEGMVADFANAFQQYLFPDLFQVPFPGPMNPRFKFIDLFAGIGWFRMAFQNLGGECVFSSEWDEQAKRTYYENYGDVSFGDITKESTKNKIPKDFDILCARREGGIHYHKCLTCLRNWSS